MVIFFFAFLANFVFLEAIVETESAGGVAKGRNETINTALNVTMTSLSISPDQTNASLLIHEHLEAWRASINYNRTKSPCFQMKTKEAVPNILMIGDSVDRNSAMGWCRMQGMPHIAHGHGHTWRRRFPQCEPFARASGSIKGIPEDKLDLRYYICEVPGYANVAFVFNELGVDSSLHCANALYTNRSGVEVGGPANMSRTDPTRVEMDSKNMSSCIRLSIGPIIEIVARSLGTVDLVQGNSLFWDLSRQHDRGLKGRYPSLYGGVNGTQQRNKFLEQWHNNFADFVRTIRDISGTLNGGESPVPPLLWRAQTRPAYQPNTSFWLNEYGTILIRNMSQAVLDLMKQEEIEVSPLHLFPNVTKLEDHIHPNTASLSAFVEYLVERALVIGAKLSPRYNNITRAEVDEMAQEKMAVVEEQLAIRQTEQETRQAGEEEQKRTKREALRQKRFENLRARKSTIFAKPKTLVNRNAAKEGPAKERVRATVKPNKQQKAAPGGDKKEKDNEDLLVRTGISHIMERRKRQKRQREGQPI